MCCVPTSSLNFGSGAWPAAGGDEGIGCPCCFAFVSRADCSAAVSSVICSSRPVTYLNGVKGAKSQSRREKEPAARQVSGDGWIRVRGFSACALLLTQACDAGGLCLPLHSLGEFLLFI